MRSLRTLAAGLVCVALLPAVSSAQSAPTYQNRWYWGAKGGVSLMESLSENISAPTAGIEWLITRERVALNLSLEQAFFETTTGILDPSAPGSVRPIGVQDMRRYHASLFAMPKAWGGFLPYAGVGVAINTLRETSPEGTFNSPEGMDSVYSFVNDQSTRASFVLTVGAQYNLRLFSFFAQGAMMPTQSNFLINGAPNTYMLEAGLRYNLAGAIEKW